MMMIDCWLDLVGFGIMYSLLGVTDCAALHEGSLGGNASVGSSPRGSLALALWWCFWVVVAMVEFSDNFWWELGLCRSRSAGLVFFFC